MGLLQSRPEWSADELAGLAVIHDRIELEWSSIKAGEREADFPAGSQAREDRLVLLFSRLMQCQRIFESNGGTVTDFRRAKSEQE